MTDNVVEQDSILVELTSEIVSAYVSNNSTVVTELPDIIQNVHSALLQVTSSTVEIEKEQPKPAVSIRRSITDDYIICLEDGKKFKSLKRHLRTHYDLSPEEYRERWRLPIDYPMVAPNYARARSELAKQMGLGRKRGSRNNT
ncbi:MAG: MucR family transcriptional regulator [Rhizobiales bacterium]|nr:MucR family transcriptional regulator [Hyphomicrobiales bacterium]